MHRKRGGPGRVVIRPRNPMARALRERLYRVRKVRSKKTYVRRPKHPKPPEGAPQA